jgi:hypothetical protein
LAKASKIYQNSIPFQFTSQNTPSDGSTESLSFLLVGTRSTGEDFTCTFGESSTGLKARIDFNFASAKTYSTSSSNTTISFQRSETAPVCSLTPLASNDPHDDDPAIVFDLRIDEGSFYIHDYSCSTTLQGDDRCYILADMSGDNKIYNDYLISQDYPQPTSDTSILGDSRLFTSNTKENAFGTLVSSFVLRRGSISMLRFSSICTGYKTTNGDFSPTVKIGLHDQYGNSATILFSCNPAPIISNIT